MMPDDTRSVRDLSLVSDQELYALEAEPMLPPAVLVEVVAESRRRRASRRASLAGLTPVRGAARLAAPFPAASAVATLGDFERVAQELAQAIARESREEVRRALDTVQARLRRIEWWLAIAPALWIAAGYASWRLWGAGG